MSFIYPFTLFASIKRWKKDGGDDFDLWDSFTEYT